MPRRAKTSDQFVNPIEQSTDHRKRTVYAYRRTLDYERYVREFRRLSNEILRYARETGAYPESELKSLLTKLARDEEKVMKAIEEYFFSWKTDLYISFLLGVRLGIRGFVQLYMRSLIDYAFAEAVIRLRYKTAWSWRGFLVQVAYDRLYNTLVQTKPEVLNAIYEAVRFADRFVELVKNYEGETISLAHEYLSWLRKQRCHTSMMAIKVTPLTLRVLHDKKGNVYTAIHMTGKTVAYSPYSRAVMPRIPHLQIVNRRKSYVERFSMKLFGTTDVIKLDTIVPTARDYKDDIYLARRLAEIVLRPYAVIKDRVRGMGFPEKRFDAEHCSVYCIPERKVRSENINRLKGMTRIYEKRNVYMRMRVI